MENLDSLCNSINRLCRSLDDKYYINCGGCCFIASILSKYLEKLGIEYRLVIYDNNDKDLNCIRNEIKNNVSNYYEEESVTGDCTCYHYCLYVVGARELNNNQINILELNRYEIIDVNSSDIRWIYEHGSWNDDYNITNNKIISDLIKSFFNEIFSN